ncbi:MAG: hypothetical protein OEW15_17650 [Nitrospirota bacterium]|nr:hypothetical protein [Nitrospirota bacterium]
MNLSILLGMVSLAIALICPVDLWNKKCSVIRRILWTPVPFIPLLGPMLYYALFEIPEARQTDRPAPKDAIERWTEWTENRYNPGYFLGGRIHPTYSARGKGIGIFFLLSGGSTLAFTLAGLFGNREMDGDGGMVMFLFSAIIAVITIFAGLARINEGKKSKKGE